jgi:hypothetical protein
MNTAGMYCSNIKNWKKPIKRRDVKLEVNKELGKVGVLSRIILKWSENVT